MPTVQELEGRIFVLEVFCMNTLAILFSLSGHGDKDNAKALATLDQIRSFATQKLQMSASPEASKEGLDYLDHLLSEISENMDLLRPGN